MILNEVKNALVACVLTFLICCVVYPAFVWGTAQLAFPRQAEGSLIRSRDRDIVGSELIAQPFVSERYFHPRPSAADYKADAASGSNLGPNNPDYRTKLIDRAKTLGATPENPAPSDLVTASGSGLDPQISVEGALFQAERVAKARSMTVEKVHSVIAEHADTSGYWIGAPQRVNVLALNRALDETSR